MRLVLIVSAFPKLSETFIVSQFLGLLEHGWDVHVVCKRSDTAEWDHFPALAADPSLRTRRAYLPDRLRSRSRTASSD